MVGTLSGITAIGTGVGPVLEGSGALSSQVGTIESRALDRTGSGALSAVRVMAYQRGPALAGDSNLNTDVVQVYAVSPATSGDGSLTSEFSGTGFKDANFAGNSALAAISSGERYLFYPALASDGALAVASYQEIQPRTPALTGGGTLSADLLPSTQVVIRIDENSFGTAGLPGGSATAGVYVTLIGNGGKGGTGFGSTSGVRASGAGGGGAAKVGRVFIPGASLGSTYSLTRGAANSAASSFSSGGVTLTANGGGAGGNAAGGTGGTAGGGGTATATGISGVPLLNGGAGGTGDGFQGTIPANNLNGAGAGGGGGGGVQTNDQGVAGRAGANSATVTGGATGLPGKAPVAAAPGNGGAGGGGGQGSAGGGAAGGAGGAYGGGGGGGSGASASAAPAGGDGGIGYNKLEWLAQVNFVTLGGDGALSAEAVAQYPYASPALGATGTLDALALSSTQTLLRIDENVSASGQGLPAGSATVGVYVTLIGSGGGAGGGCANSAGVSRGGGGGGGGGAFIGRTFIPIASLGSTYSVVRPTGGPGGAARSTSAAGNVGTAGGASSFTSGSVTLSAGGGGAGLGGNPNGAPVNGGVGGTTSVSGVTASVVDAGTAGGQGLITAEAGVNNGTSNSGAAGGAGGAGTGSNDTPQAAAAGGTANGQAAGAAGNTVDATGGAAPVAGIAGSGAGSCKAGVGTVPQGSGANANGYGGGGGGGAGHVTGSNQGKGGDGGPGYVKLEWVAQMLLPTLTGGGTLSATAVKAVNISFVGAMSASTGTTCTVPAHQPGDLMIIVASRSTNTGFATVPAGWNTAGSYAATGGIARSFIVGWKIATATNDVSGTWTNAIRLMGGVYRGASAVGAFVGNSNTVNDNAMVYPAAAFNAPSSWCMRVGQHFAATDVATTTLAGYTNRDTSSNASTVKDSSGPVGGSGPAAGSVIVGASSTWITCTVEIQ